MFISCPETTQMKSSPSQTINLLQSLAFPVIACALSIRFWDTLHPFAFLLFYPAVLCSGWLCGLKGGVAATVLSVVLIAVFFMEPSSIIAPAKAISLNYGALAIFLCAGFRTSSCFSARHFLISCCRVASIARRLFLFVKCAVSQTAMSADSTGKPN